MVKHLVLVLLTLVSFPGCSVFMAASSSEAPDLSVLRSGATIKEVNQALGKPISFLRTDRGDIAVYQYFTGDKANYKRAATYAVLDGLTVGLAEVITSPAESLQGDKHVITVQYTRGGHLTAVSQSVKKAPLEAPEKIIEDNLPKSS